MVETPVVVVMRIFSRSLPSSTGADVMYNQYRSIEKRRRRMIDLNEEIN